MAGDVVDPKWPNEGDTSKDFCVCAGEVGNDDNASASSMQPKEEGAMWESAAGAFHTVASLPITSLVKCHVNCRVFVSNHASAQYCQVTRAAVRCLWQFVAEVSDVGVIREGNVRR